MNPFLSTFSEQCVAEEKAVAAKQDKQIKLAANDDKYHKGYFCADKDAADSAAE